MEEVIKKIPLKEQMLKLRERTDIKLPLKGYVIVTIDGRAFSNLVKNKYDRPFDDKFISIMNETAKYICKQVQGCKFAYVQSDEATFVLTDFENDANCPFFANRLTKLLSIIPSLATAKFNQLVIANLCDTPCSNSDLKEMILKIGLASFDCKCCFTRKPNIVYSYYLWRQLDCIRNSKQQTAQAWLSHKTLDGLNTDEQIKLLRDRNGVDWELFDDDKKYGRFIRKETEPFHNDALNIDYERHIWREHPAFPIMGKGGREKFFEYSKIPNIYDFEFKKETES